MATQKYDLIFAGAGLAALSMITQMAELPFFAEKKILLIDRHRKEKNDRTWCFWATPAELKTMPPVIAHSWSDLRFHSDLFAARLDTGDYQYHMVRGIDFYRWAKEKLAGHPFIEWLHSDIEEIDAANGTVTTADGKYCGEWIFNSALVPFPLLPELDSNIFRTPFTALKHHIPDKYIYLLQHFKGWMVRTSEPVFDPLSVTFMDFRTAQSGDTRFVYVLPVSPTEALIEFTVFSPDLLPMEEYDAGLRQYLKQFLHLETYEITETEFGVIPMTDYPFPQARNGHVIHIGTAGGFVKGSSGYAFKRTQRRTAAFVQQWVESGRPDTAILRSRWRYRAYDSIFLRTLADSLVPADIIFSSFFKNIGGKAAFEFLDEDSGFLADIRALHAMPLLPFITAAIRQSSRLWYV